MQIEHDKSKWPLVFSEAVILEHENCPLTKAIITAKDELTD